MKHPNKPTEAQTKLAVKQYLRANRILYLSIQQMRPARDKKGRIYFIPIDNEQLGAPDLIIPGPGSIALETKSWNGKLSDNQIKWAKKATEWGIKCFKIHSLEDLEKALK